eukprot:6377584-Lingulodinium_polyedra.AAC.1
MSNVGGRPGQRLLRARSNASADWVARWRGARPLVGTGWVERQYGPGRTPVRLRSNVGAGQ